MSDLRERALAALSSACFADHEAREETIKRMESALRDARGAGIREAAGECTKFLVGDPANGIPLRSPMPSECADRILALIEKDAPA